MPYTIEDIKALEDVVHRVALLNRNAPTNDEEQELAIACARFVTSGLLFSAFMRSELARQNREPPSKRHKNTP